MCRITHPSKWWIATTLFFTYNRDVFTVQLGCWRHVFQRIERKIFLLKGVGKGKSDYGIHWHFIPNTKISPFVVVYCAMSQIKNKFWKITKELCLLKCDYLNYRCRQTVRFCIIQLISSHTSWASCSLLVLCITQWLEDQRADNQVESSVQGWPGAKQTDGKKVIRG